MAYLTGPGTTSATLRGEGEFWAGGQPITLVTPSGTRQYRGRLRAAAPAGPPRRDTVNILPLESYLRGVVPLEMPALWTPAAVRSQSVAARTYAAYERAHARAGHYQLCDTTSCQVYGGYSAEHPAANAAIDATRQQVLLSGGDPAFTQFSSSSGGWTSAGSFSYLPAKRDPYDAWSGNPVHGWSTKVTDARLENQWPAVGNLTSMATTRDGNGEWGGRVRTVTLTGSRGTVQVSGDTFRVGARPALDLAHLPRRPALSTGRRATGRRRSGVIPRRVGVVAASTSDGSAQARTSTRSPPSTDWGPEMAIRCTVPATGAVIEASIFIASTVATVSPAATRAPSSTTTVTTPWNGAAT